MAAGPRNRNHVQKICMHWHTVGIVPSVAVFGFGDHGASRNRAERPRQGLQHPSPARAASRCAAAPAPGERPSPEVRTASQSRTSKVRGTARAPTTVRVETQLGDFQHLSGSVKNRAAVVHWTSSTGRLGRSLGHTGLDTWAIESIYCWPAMPLARAHQHALWGLYVELLLWGCALI